MKAIQYFSNGHKEEENMMSEKNKKEMRVYRNPVLYADYSDPDVIRVGDDYFMIASSFTYIPGVPVLHSKDLVHWERINYVVKHLPFSHYDAPVHGSGTWAPSIRYYDGMFYAFVPLPDEGIFVSKTADPYGEWSPLHCIKEAKGWIDPCPLWDDDGNVYLVFAYAKSRSGMKHKLSICELDAQTLDVVSEPVEIYDGSLQNPTIEGPKFYKMNGWYYIFAPAGGVATGWQTILRSENIYGPYEYRIVMHQGNTGINGPHQGGWVRTVEGTDFFMHFQDVGAMGRIVHLQPMDWNNGWPFIGEEQNGDGIGEPVEQWCIPQVDDNVWPGISMDDDFEEEKLGLQWQWQADFNKSWYSISKEKELNLFCAANSKRSDNYLWYAPNACTQMLHSPCFTAEIKMRLFPDMAGDLAGAGLLGHEYSYFAMEYCENMRLILRKGIVEKIDYEGMAAENIVASIAMPQDQKAVWMRISLQKDETYYYQYSFDGKVFHKIEQYFALRQCTWTGAKFVLYACNYRNQISDGYGVYEYVHFLSDENNGKREHSLERGE